MSFEKTALLRHPLVEQAYASVQAVVDMRADEVKEAVAAAEIYSAHAQNPKAEVVAAMLFNCYAYPHVVDTLGQQVKDLTDFAIETASWDKVVTCNGNADHADILLAHVAVQSQVLHKEISKRAFYIFDQMQHRLLVLRTMLDLASLDSDSTALIDQTQSRFAATMQAQVQRIEKVRESSVFAKSGLPAHPLVERVYEDVRQQKFKVNPHAMPVDYELGAVKILLAEVDHVDPEMIAAVLLNQCFKSTPEMLDTYGSRVAELHAVTAPLASAPQPADYLDVDGAADILAAKRVLVLESRLASFTKTQRASKEDALYDLEMFMTSARKLAATGAVSPRLATRLCTAASAAQNLVHAPENTVIRKPGSPRPDQGW